MHVLCTPLLPLVLLLLFSTCDMDFAVRRSSARRRTKTPLELMKSMLDMPGNSDEPQNASIKEEEQEILSSQSSSTVKEDEHALEFNEGNQ